MAPSKALPNEKLKAEIEKFKLEAEKLKAENNVMLNATLNHMSASVAKMQAETAKAEREKWYYPFIAGAAFFGALTALATALLRLLV